MPDTIFRRLLRIILLLDKPEYVCYTYNKEKMKTYKKGVEVMTNEEFQKFVVEKLNSMDSKIDAVEKKVDATEKKVDAVEKKVDATEKKVDATEKKVDATEKKVGTIENKIDVVEKKVDTVVKKLDAVCEQTANLMEFRTEVNAKLDIIVEDNKSIHELLGEHEVSIRTLRRKPV